MPRVDLRVGLGATLRKVRLAPVQGVVLVQVHFVPMQGFWFQIPYRVWQLAGLGWLTSGPRCEPHGTGFEGVQNLRAGCFRLLVFVVCLGLDGWE